MTTQRRNTLPLTPYQTSILVYWRAFYAKHGQPPGIRQVMLACGGRSTNGVVDALNLIASKGYSVVRRRHGLSLDASDLAVDAGAGLHIADGSAAALELLARAFQRLGDTVHASACQRGAEAVRREASGAPLGIPQHQRELAVESLCARLRSHVVTKGRAA